MTGPAGDAGPQLPRQQRFVSRLQRKPLTVGRAARIIALATIFVTVVGGVLIHFTDPSMFPNVGLGLWWAVQTVTTVGYGDIVPTSSVGRLVATAVMLSGIGFLSVVTAAITSSFIEQARRRIAGGQTDTLVTMLDQINGRLDDIEAQLRESGRRES